MRKAKEEVKDALPPELKVNPFQKILGNKYFI